MQYTIKYTNIWGQIAERLPEELVKYIDEKTRFHPDGYKYTWNFKHHRWDGFNHLFNIQEQVFRVGLLQRITNALEFHGHTTRREYVGPQLRERHIKTRIPEGVIRPYDFQQKVRQVVREEQRGIISSPTGSGKTLMAALMIDELKLQTLIILNDRVLLDQMHRVMTRCFPDMTIGYIGDNEFELGDVTVATVQSLRSILGIIKKKTISKSMLKKDELEEWLKSTSVVIHDEVHLADADTCVVLYALFDNINYIFGFSATPYDFAQKQAKTSNIELEQIFHKVIYSTHDIDFIKLGLCVPVIVKSVQVPEVMKVYGTWRDNQSELYKKAVKYEILENDAWLKCIQEQVEEFNKENMSCFVYAGHSLEYGEKVAKTLGASFIQGKTPRKQRFAAFDALHNKEISCIVSDIGGIGLDIPSLDAIVLATDMIDVRQIRGRVGRAHPGKTVGHVVDMFKDCSFLSSHRKTRLEQYKLDGNVIL